MKKKNHFLKFLLIIFLFLPPIVHGESLHKIESSHAIVFYNSSLKASAENILKIFPQVKSELQYAVGWPVDFIPKIILIQDSRRFKEIAGNPFVIAFAVPKKQLIVMDCSRINTPPFTFPITLKHELCHLLLHRHIKTHIPRWLDEGTAQWVCGGISELFISVKDDVLRPAVLSGNIIRLGDLNNSFPRDKTALSLAYEESRSIVEYIVSEFGIRGLLNILEQMRRGIEADTAIKKAIFISPRQLEKRWHSYLGRNVTWLIWLTVHIYEILFFLAAIASIYGFFRLYIKKRTYKDDDFLDDEENDY